MFELDGVHYINKFNLKKYKTIETVTKVSIMGVSSSNNGFLPLNILEQVFSLTLIEEATNEVVPQTKALALFEKAVEEYGLVTVSRQVMERLEADLGFLFR